MNNIVKKLFFPILFISVLATILFINYFPHYNALINTPNNFVYSGHASWFDLWDIENYFAVIKLAQKEQSLLLSNVNTTSVVKPAFVYPIYTIAAIIFPKVNNILLYHALAILFGILLAVEIYILSKLLLKKTFKSFYALLIISLGGGLGFLFSYPDVSADLYVPGVTFFSTFQKPHEALAALLYMSSLVFFFLAVTERKKIFLVISIIAFLFLIPIYPYRLLSFILITIIFLFILKKEVKKNYPILYLKIFSIFVIPPALIYLIHFFNSGFSVLVSYQRNPISPLSLFLGYGFFLVIFIYQLFLTEKKSLLIQFLNIWVLVSLGLSILPFGLSRLYLSGLLFPMSLLFMLHIDEISKKSRLPSYLILVIASFFILPTSIYAYKMRITEVKNYNIWYYFSEKYENGFEYISKRDQNGILALPPLSNYIPAQTGKRMYFGIKDQTPDYDQKYQNAVQFYAGKMSVVEARNFLSENNISMIILTHEEERTSNLYYRFLNVVYENDEIKIFKQNID